MTTDAGCRFTTEDGRHCLLINPVHYGPHKVAEATATEAQRCGWLAESHCLLEHGHDGPHNTAYAEQLAQARREGASKALRDAANEAWGRATEATSEDASWRGVTRWLRDRRTALYGTEASDG